MKSVTLELRITLYPGNAESCRVRAHRVPERDKVRKKHGGQTQMFVKYVVSQKKKPAKELEFASDMRNASPTSCQTCLYSIRCSRRCIAKRASRRAVSFGHTLTKEYESHCKGQRASKRAHLDLTFGQPAMATPCRPRRL